MCGAEDARIRRRVPELLRRLELTERADALPRELSGGEKARTAIARAIAHTPLILLADEPTQNLDPKQAKDVLEAFREINAEGTTVIIATHDHALVDTLQTRVIELEKGRITRDSVGGYRQHAAAKHEEKKEEHMKTESAKKIRVTAIHSEG